MEPILLENPNRFVLFPIKHHDVWNIYKQAEARVWNAEVVDLAPDFADWDKLSKEEVEMLKQVFAFFASCSGIITENLSQQFLKEVQLPEARCFYGLQLANENIHSETFSLILKTFVNDSGERDRLFQGLRTIPTIKRKADWALSWIDEGRPFSERLIAFAAVESIFFSGSFSAISWLKKRGLLPGLTFANDLIIRDEKLHCEFACLLYSMLETPLDAEVIRRIVTEAVILEKEYMVETLAVSLQELDAKSMMEYIESEADRLMIALGLAKMYGTSNPFPWMEKSLRKSEEQFSESETEEYNSNIAYLK